MQVISIAIDYAVVLLWQPEQWPATQHVEPQVGQVTQRPEVIDDFIRNFLVKMGLSQTLEMFETEWYAQQDAPVSATIVHALHTCLTLFSAAQNSPSYFSPILVWSRVLLDR